MPQNFSTRCSFGKQPNGDAWPVGTVLPEYVFQGHDVAGMVAKGLLLPTGAPVIVKLAPPKSAAPDAALETVHDERDRLVEENKALREREPQYLGTIAQLEQARDAHRDALPKYVEENSGLRAACDDHQKQNDKLAAEMKQTKADLDAIAAENAKLKADLDAATKPAPKGK